MNEKLVTPLNIVALIMAYLAYKATQKYGAPFVDKAVAALPKGK